MKYETLVVRYGEMTLKKGNRKQFIGHLRRNIKEALSSFSEVRIHSSFDRIFIQLNGMEYLPVVKQLQKVFGIHSIEVVLTTDLEIENIQKGALLSFQSVERQVQTFKVETKRSNKSYPLSSYEINHAVGGYILKNTKDLNVDVHNPDLTVKVEIRGKEAFITCLVYKGLGGFPVGTSGKVLLLLSGGIDSPVAGFLTMRKGVELEVIHFHSPPYTNERAKQKVEDLARKLSVYGGSIKLHLVPFTNVQEQIHKLMPPNYTMTIMRRMMFRIAEKIAENNNILALATGESLGQVASQTLHSMNVINEVTTLPIIRPLVSMDKVEITKWAREIDTYDISILPYEDCCTIFLPSSPKTKPKRKDANKFEQYLPIDELVEQAVNETKVMKISAKDYLETEFKQLF
ncbi:MAG TPA: tRNA uracil 4-sulfurtransferase ThiI [Massilibacterium sp.]|nr:tRNA uracil 4-sulfurtransferase ThiI [Massilibacterium sp.]